MSAINYTGTNQRTEFTYDGIGNRVRFLEQVGATVISDKRFVWDGNTIAEERDAQNVLVKQFYEEGVRIAGANYYYVRDHLGSIRDLTDSTGTIRARYEYDAWGERTKLSGNLDADFGFTGHYQHGPSTLIVAPRRFYSALFGRWLSPDPIEEEGGINLYAYVLNNPVRSIDPLGLASDPYGFDEAETVGTMGSQRGINIANRAPKIVQDTAREAATDVIMAVAGEVGLWEKFLSLFKWSNKCEKVATYGTTPCGRPLTKHYATETGPVRNIPGSVVDNTIDTTKGVAVAGGKTVHYDPVNNITVVTGNGGSIISVHKGKP